jgi:hypothetical protein
LLAAICLPREAFTAVLDPVRYWAVIPVGLPRMIPSLISPIWEYEARETKINNVTMMFLYTASIKLTFRETRIGFAPEG